MSKKQNGYEKRLREKFGNKYASLLLRDYRVLVAASLTEPTNRTAKQSKRIAEWYSVGTLVGETMSEPHALAVVSILYDQTENKLTTNLDNFLGYAFTRKNFEELENSGILQFFCVAYPYQVAFLI